MKFIDKLTQRLDSIDSQVCVGLDSRYDRIPEMIKKNQSVRQAILSFNKHVIDATHHLATAYKSNLAFYAGFGIEGLEGLRLTNEYLFNNYPEIPLLADAKRSEMDESAKMTKKEIFEYLKFDCIMVTPWFGFDTVKPYLETPEYGVAIYVHDSNKTAVEFQDLMLANGEPLYGHVTRTVCTTWNKNENIILEAGATYPDQLRKIRKIAGEKMPIITAGIGAQGASVTDLIGVFGQNAKRLLVNSSRNIIFAGEGKKDYFLEVKNSAENLRSALLVVSRRISS